jgi:hypothetical protein
VTTTYPAADPVARHVAELERVLRGPARVRRSMVREVRDGLQDAVDAYLAAGLDRSRAAAQAVRDFGPVREIAPRMQDELTARQGRWTALLVAVIFPGMTLGWDLLWRSGRVDWEPGPPPSLIVAFARLQDSTAVVLAVTAVVLLAATFLRTVPPRRVTALAGVIAGTGAVVCGGTGVLMNVTNGRAAAVMLATNPYALPAFGVSALMCTFVIYTAVRTLHVARAG